MFLLYTIHLSQKNVIIFNEISFSKLMKRIFQMYLRCVILMQRVKALILNEVSTDVTYNAFSHAALS